MPAAWMAVQPHVQTVVDQPLERVVGVEPNPGGPPYALLAREEDGELVYAGSAFVMLPTKVRDRFWERAEALKIEHPVVKETQGAESELR